jgi:hypothetical protein
VSVQTSSKNRLEYKKHADCGEPLIFFAAASLLPEISVPCALRLERKIMSRQRQQDSVVGFHEEPHGLYGWLVGLVRIFYSNVFLFQNSGCFFFFFLLKNHVENVVCELVMSHLK